MRITGIYKITSPSKRVYIGQSKNISERWKSYKYLLNKPYISQRKLANSFKKYGIGSHLFEVLEECTLEQLNEKELYWQNHYDTINKGLNSLTVKDGGIPQKMSKDTIERMRISANKEDRKLNFSKRLKELHKKGAFKYCNSKKKKKVYQFDLKGNFIKEWDGVVEIIKTIPNYKKTSIIRCCSITDITKSAYGFQWSYTKYAKELPIRKNR